MDKGDKNQIHHSSRLAAAEKEEEEEGRHHRGGGGPGGDLSGGEMTANATAMVKEEEDVDMLLLKIAEARSRVARMELMASSQQQQQQQDNINIPPTFDKLYNASTAVEDDDDDDDDMQVLKIVEARSHKAAAEQITTADNNTIQKDNHRAEGALRDDSSRLQVVAVGVVSKEKEDHEDEEFNIMKVVQARIRQSQLVDGLEATSNPNNYGQELPPTEGTAAEAAARAPAPATASLTQRGNHHLQPGAYLEGPGSLLQRADKNQYDRTAHHYEDDASYFLPEPPAPTTNTNSNGPSLVEANSVHEDTERGMVVDRHARPMDLEEVRKKEERWKRQKKVFLGLLIFLCIAAAFAVGYVVGRHRQAVVVGEDPMNTNNNETDVAPTPSSLPPFELENLQLLYEDLSETTRQSLHGSDTPQRKAWEWLLGHQNITNLEEWRKTQIFAMAAFFFAMEGPTWPKRVSQDWLNETIEECAWINTDVEYLMGLSFTYLNTTIYDLNPCNAAGELQTLFLLALALENATPHMPPEISLLTSLSVLGFLASGIAVPLIDVLTPELMQLSRLNVLVLQGNGILGALPEGIGQMTSLKHLLIGQNKLTGTLPKGIIEMKELEFIVLDSNSLTGSLPSELGLMTSMTDLTLVRNELTGSIPSELGVLRNLTGIALAQNSLVGTIPSELALLSSTLQMLIIEENALSGQIPTEFGRLSNVDYLNLDRNFLTGPVPSELGLMRIMLEMLLAENELTGSIPSELGLMTMLTRLRLQENALSSSIAR